MATAQFVRTSVNARRHALVLAVAALPLWAGGLSRPRQRRRFLVAAARGATATLPTVIGAAGGMFDDLAPVSAAPAGTAVEPDARTRERATRLGLLTAAFITAGSYAQRTFDPAAPAWTRDPHLVAAGLGQAPGALAAVAAGHALHAHRAQRRERRLGAVLVRAVPVGRRARVQLAAAVGLQLLASSSRRELAVEDQAESAPTTDVTSRS